MGVRKKPRPLRYRQSDSSVWEAKLYNPQLPTSKQRRIRHLDNGNIAWSLLDCLCEHLRDLVSLNLYIESYNHDIDFPRILTVMNSLRGHTNGV
jgi:hypothetical protein